MAHSLPTRNPSDEIASFVIEHPDISGPVGVLVVPLLASAAVHVSYTDDHGKVRQLTDIVWGKEWRKELAEIMQAPDAKVAEMISARVQRSVMR